MSCAAGLVPEENTSQTTLCPNILQLTASTFLVPAAICVVQGRLLGVMIHSSNAVCSTYVHRQDRACANDAYDVLDHILVFAWVCYNVYMVSFWPSFAAEAVACAVVVLACKIGTRCLQYRSLPRYVFHSVMHVSGTVGSILLLV